MNTPRRSLSVEWRLRNAAGDEIPFHIHPKESLSIGRDLGADISILDAGVSRHHALLELDGDDLWLEDLHTGGGTTVNGEPIRRVRIESGDVLTFGRVTFTLASMGSEDVGGDPLRGLSRDQIIGLLRLSREIHCGGERSLLLQIILQAAVDEFGAERGLVFLRAPDRSGFHPAAAHPPELLATSRRVLPSGAAERIARGPGARAMGPCAMGAPLGCGARPSGIIYVERDPEKGFERDDEGLLSAIAWVASPAVETAARLEAMRAWNSRLEGALAGSSRPGGGRTGNGSESRADAASILGLAETHLHLEGARVRGSEEGGKASAVLDDAAVFLAAARRLQDRRSARAEEIQIGQALEDAFRGESAGAHGELSLAILDGGDLTILCAPDELAALLRLARSWLVPPEARDGAACRARASVASDGRTIELALSVQAAEGCEPRPGEALSLLRRLVAERLGGAVDWSPGERELRLRFPNLASEVRETVLLGELAKRGMPPPGG